VQQRALNYDIRPGPHRLQGLLSLGGVDSPTLNLDDVDTQLLEVLDILPLMHEPPLNQGLQDRIPDLRFA
jgi:hypothetical protein